VPSRASGSGPNGERPSKSPRHSLHCFEKASRSNQTRGKTGCVPQLPHECLFRVPRSRFCLTRIRRMFVIKGEHFLTYHGSVGGERGRHHRVCPRPVDCECQGPVCLAHVCKSLWSRRLYGQEAPELCGYRSPPPAGVWQNCGAA